MRKDAGICACSQPFISEMRPSQATGQKAKRPGKGSGSIRESFMLLEVIQAVISLLGTQAAGGVESLRVTSRTWSPLLLAQGITEAHSKSLMPCCCLPGREKGDMHCMWLHGLPALTGLGPDRLLEL